jgi:hypothetical protein
MAELLKLDEVAYVRYASIYRHFENLEQFVSEVRALREQQSAPAAGAEAASGGGAAEPAPEGEGR